MPAEIRRRSKRIPSGPRHRLAHMDIDPSEAVLAACPCYGTSPRFAGGAFGYPERPSPWRGRRLFSSSHARAHRVPRLRRLPDRYPPRGNPETVRSWTSVISVTLVLPLKRLLALLRPTSPHLLRLSPFVAKSLGRQKSSALASFTNLPFGRLRVYRHLSPTLLTSTPTLQLRVPGLLGRLTLHVAARQSRKGSSGGSLLRGAHLDEIVTALKKGIGVTRLLLKSYFFATPF